MQRFSDYDQRSRAILKHAAGLVDDEHGRLWPEHLLRAFLASPDARHVFGSSSSVWARTPPEPPVAPGVPGLTDAARRVLDGAEAEARHQGSRAVMPGHVLIGLIELQASPVREWLLAAGVSTVSVREAAAAD